MATTTTTLELIFSGLLLLSLPEGDRDNAVVLFPEDTAHSLNLAFLEGTTCTDLASDQGSRNVHLEIQGNLSIDYPDGERKLRWIRDPVGRVPESPKEAAYLSWVPSISTMVPGTSRLLGDCDDPSDTCSGAKARFFVDRGMISSCHLVHNPAKTGRVQLYRLEVNGLSRALADTIVVTEKVALAEGDSLILTMSGRRCKLAPGEGKQRVVLLVSNAPTDQGHSLSHFRLLHRFHDELNQRMSQSIPRPAGNLPLAKGKLGACEDAIVEAQRAINYQRGLRGLKVLIVHSPSECGTATQP